MQVTDYMIKLKGIPGTISATPAVGGHKDEQGNFYRADQVENIFSRQRMFQPNKEVKTVYKITLKPWAEIKEVALPEGHEIYKKDHKTYLYLPRSAGKTVEVTEVASGYEDKDGRFYAKEWVASVISINTSVVNDAKLTVPEPVSIEATTIKIPKRYVIDVEAIVKAPNKEEVMFLCVVNIMEHLKFSLGGEQLNEKIKEFYKVV